MTHQPLHRKASGWCPVTRVWVASKVGLDALEKRRMSCLLALKPTTSLQDTHYTWLRHLGSQTSSLSLWNSVYNRKVPHTHTCRSCVILNDKEKIAKNKNTYFIKLKGSILSICHTIQYFQLQKKETLSAQPKRNLTLSKSKFWKLILKHHNRPPTLVIIKNYSTLKEKLILLH
jgi:hypothetical protein